MTNRDVLMAELSALDDDKLFKIFCDMHNDHCDGCSFNGMYCPVSSSPKFVSSSGWMNRSYPCRNEKITYQDCADAMLMMWMDKVLTDGEYSRIMDKLNANRSRMETDE